MSKRKYYNFAPVLSYNAIYNFVVGGRGIGKSYGAKKRAIDDAIKRGREFIYLRRYTKELTSSRDTFMADIEHLYPEHDFRTHNGKLQYTAFVDPDSFEDESEYNKALKARDWTTAGHFIALVTAQHKKSVAYPNVYTIIYDEFIIEKGALRYLPSEHVAFNNFYSTVDRWNDRVKVLFLANSVSIMNPYFIAYDIVPEPGREFVKRGGGFVVAHFPDSDEFANDVYQTRFGRFISGTEYADYAVGNTFADNNDSLIEVKGAKARYQFTLECLTGTFSVWYAMGNNTFYVQEKLPKEQEVYTLVPERMAEGKTLMSVRDKPLAYLRSSFNTGRMLFDKPSTRNTLREIFKR